MATPWNQNEVSFIMEYFKTGISRGVTVTELGNELSKVDELQKRTAPSIIQKYYKELKRIGGARKDNSSPDSPSQQKRTITNDDLTYNLDYDKETPIRRVTPLTPSNKRMKVGVEELLGLEYDWEVIEAFEGLPDYIAELKNEINELKGEMNKPQTFNLSAFLAEMNSLQAKVRSVEKLEEVIQTQHLQIQDLQAKIKSHEGNFERIKADYQDACSWFSVFMDSSSINQMMSMGDVKTRLKTVLDKWGVVLSATIEK